MTENVFAGMFSLLVKNRSVDNKIFLDYKTSELDQLAAQSGNAIVGILHGLECIGNLLATLSHKNKHDMNQIGHFLVLMTNLMDALLMLRSDCEYSIKKP